jgi:hypothetical protein
MMYRLILRAQFENPAELDRAVQGLNQLEMQGAKVNVSMAGMGRAGTEGLDSLGYSVLRVGFMFNMMESALMRQEMASLYAENAQNRLNDAVAKYGANSVQAQRATQQYHTEMEYLNNANMRANVSMGLMATSLILQSGLLREATWSQIAHTASLAASTLEHWAHVAALQAEVVWEAIVSQGLAVPAMLAGGAAVAGVAYAAGAGYFSSKTTTANINVETKIDVSTNIDDALKKQNQKVKDEWRRLSP